MDLNQFSRDSFHLKDWVNNLFNHPEAKECKEVKQYTCSMVMRLQLAIQEVNNTIEDASSQIVTTLPRVLRDVEALSHEASLLKTQMNTVKKDIEQVERNTAASMQTLVELDTVKGRLSASSQALKEADNWTTLSADIEEVMDCCDLEVISSKLTSLQNCLSILSHVPDYEERVANLDGLKVRLEAMLSPYLVAAFGKHDIDDSMKYAQILSALGRSRNLESYYHKCETQQMSVAWRGGVEGHVMSAHPAWITAFYQQLSSLITKQVKWCEQVFVDSDPHLLLAELCLKVVTSLDPTVTHVTSVAVKQQDDPLAFMGQVKTALHHFWADYCKVMEGCKKNEIIPLNMAVLSAVWSPLQDQVRHYGEYEEALLVAHLMAADLVQDDVSESLQLLKNYCGKLLQQAEYAAERCVQLTCGYAFPSLVGAIVSYLDKYLECVARVTRCVDVVTSSTSSSSRHDDWTLFNTCLVLIQTSGEFLLSVDSIENFLSTALLNVTKNVPSVTSNVASVTSMSLILSEKEEKAYKEMVHSSVENDSPLLLNISSLAQSQCEKSVQVALSTIMAPISAQLAPVANLPAWNSLRATSSSLSASFSPQEYVTQIGQYLMTLPQHLEPLLVNHSPSLNRALQETDLRSGSESRMVSESEVSAADFLIHRVSEATCRLYSDVIIRIHKVANPMVTQLTTDIDYLVTILSDLGVTSCSPLDQLSLLLKAPPDTFWKGVHGLNPRLVAAVRQIREIPAKS